MIGVNVGRAAARLAACMIATLALGIACAVPADAAMELKDFKFDLSSPQAGGHPDANLLSSVKTGSGEVLENLEWVANPGFILEAESVPSCSSFSGCSPAAQIGVVTVRGEYEGTPEFLFGTAPVYQLTARSGQSLRLGFTIPTVGLPVEGEAVLPTSPDYPALQPYQLRFGFDRLPTSASLKTLTSLDMTLWGVPAAPAHDEERFPEGSSGCPGSETTSCIGETHPSGAPQRPLTLSAVYCEPGNDLINWDPWVIFSTHEGRKEEKVNPATFISSCQGLGFTPSLTVAPTTTAGYSASGLTLDVKDPQEQAVGQLSQSELQAAVITTHALVLEPALLEHPACEDAAAAITNNQPSACPAVSKIGTVKFEMAGVSQSIPGQIFLGHTVNGKIRFFVVGTGAGLELKQLGTIDQLTFGRLKFTFGAQPRLPITEEEFGFLPNFVRTPVHCGSYQAEGALAPWEPNHATATGQVHYSIASGPNGPCIGIPTNIEVQLAPASMAADGSSQTTATVAVRDSEGNGVPAEEVQLSSSDPQQKIGPVVDNEDGTYSAVITGSTTAGPATITARDVSANPALSGSATLTQTGEPQVTAAPPILTPPAPRAPVVRFLKKPAREGGKRHALFGFAADLAGATFGCRLDQHRFHPCSSPVVLRKLSLGWHTFSVRAASGAVLGPATTWRFRVTRPTHRH